MSLEQFKAKVIEHSIAPHGGELITLQLQYPRFIHAEFMTHRVFSRNAASSRAIPVAKMIAQVRENPAMPVHWGKNQPGMQAKEQHNAHVLLEELIEFDNPSDTPLFTLERGIYSVQEAWERAAKNAADVALAMADAGYHKQVVNRLLEPFQLMQVIVTATEWDNFFELRDHPDAQPEIQVLARLMKEAIKASVPEFRGADARDSYNWHLPYVTPAERDAFPEDPYTLAKYSGARCARVSYLNHDGTNPDPAKDLTLYGQLVGGEPLHASPVEHQGHPYLLADRWCKNFRGWHQFRADVEEQVLHAKATVEHEGADCD